MKKYICLIVFFISQINPGLYAYNEDDYTFILLNQLDRITAKSQGRNPADVRLECQGRDFSGLDLTEWNFEGATLKYCKFTGCRLNRVKFKKAILTGCDFSCSNLTDACFVEAVARGANFLNCRFGATDFKRADLRFSDFRDRRVALYWRTTIFLVNELSAFFEGADLSYANFIETRVDGVLVDKHTKVVNTLFVYSDPIDLDFLPPLLKNRSEAFYTTPAFLDYIRGKICLEDF